MSGSCSIANTASPTSTASSFTNNTTTTLLWTISNGVCSSSSDTLKIVSNSSFCAATLADFTASATTTCTGSSITFSDLSSNATSWSWNFGSNATPATANTQGPHTVSYSSTGAKTVSLVATGPGGSNTKTKTSYITVIGIPGTPTGISGTSNLCAGTNAVVYSIASVATASNYTWTVPSGATIVSGSGTTSITVNYSAAATSGNVTVYAANACGNGSPATLAITVAQSPSAANAGSDQLNLCGVTSATLAATAPTVGTGAWSIVSGGSGTFSNSASANSSFTGTAGSTYTLRWTVSNSPCTSNSDDVVIVFNQNPSSANAGPDQTSLCGATSATLAANTPSVGTGAWSIISGSGGSFSNSSLPNSVFIGNSGSTYVLRWTISNSPCTSSTDDVTISFPLNPSSSFAGSDQAICGVTSATMAATIPSVGTGAWSIISGSGGSFSNSASASSTFSGVAGTTYVLRWTVSNAPCSASSDDVSISFLQNPSTSNAGTDQLSLCGVSSTTLAANTPSVGTGVWTIVSGGSGTFSSSSSPNSSFTGTIGSTYTLRWSITANPCGSSTDDVVITFNQNPTIANAGSDQTLCGQTAATLSANAPAFGSGSWSVVSGTGGNFISGSSPTTTFTGNAGVTYTLRWTISNSPCGSSSDDVTISFPQNPTIANAGPDQTICGLTTATLAATAPSVGIGTWSKISGAGGSFSNASTATSAFNGTAGVTYVLRWTVANAPCISSTDDVTISFQQNPSLALAGNDQTLCGQTNATLAANAPSVGTGLWSITSGTGGSFSNSASATSGFTGVAGNTYVLRWTISNSSCTPSFDEVSISFPQNPTVANAGSDINSCATTTTAMNANAPAVGSGVWSILTGSGGSFSSTSNPLANFSGVLGTTYVLRWTISNASCVASSDDITVQFQQPPTTAFAGNDTLICNGSTISLAANTPVIGVGKWTIASGAANLTSVNAPNTSAAGFMNDTNTVLVWTVSTANSCPDSRDTVIITSNTSVCIVTLADFTVDTTITCVGSTINFTDASNQATSWIWDFGAGANPATAIGIGPHSVSYNSPGLKTVSLTVNGPGGTDTKTRTNLIDVRQAPGAASAITGLSTVCAGQTEVGYSINPVLDADAYNWLLPNGASIVSFNQNAVTVDYSALASSGNITVEAVNGCGTGPNSTLAITVNELPDTASVILGIDTLCDGASGITYTSAAIANATWYKWTLSNGLIASSDSTLTPQVSIQLTPGINSGTIQLTGYNSCGSGVSSPVFNLYIAPYPDAAGSISGATLVSACANQNGIGYSVAPIVNANSYNWQLPAQATIVSGAGTNSIVVDYSTGSSSGDVIVNGVNTCGAGLSSNLAVNFTPIPVTEICYATVDSATIKSILYWQRPQESYVDSFVIYSDPTGGSNLNRIGALKNNPAVATNYLDLGSFPIINAISYQIATKDSCNNQLSLSATVVHKTINLNGTLGWSGAAKLYWNEYLGVNDPSRYYAVIRDSTGVGPFNDTLATNIPPAPNMSYTDTSSYHFPSCRYVIVMLFNTNCNKDLRIMANKSTTRSNIKNRAAMVPDAFEENAFNNFSTYLYPNPAKGLTHLVLFGQYKNYQIKLIDLLGQVIQQNRVVSKIGEKTSIDLPVQNLAPGLYFVNVENEKGIQKVLKLKIE